MVEGGSHWINNKLCSAGKTLEALECHGDELGFKISKQTVKVLGHGRSE